MYTTANANSFSQADAHPSDGRIPKRPFIVPAADDTAPTPGIHEVADDHQEEEPFAVDAKASGFEEDGDNGAAGKDHERQLSMPIHEKNCARLWCTCELHTINNSTAAVIAVSQTILEA